MAWYLNDDISFCELDGRLFFLDVQRDSYFQLPATLERSFLSYLAAPNGGGVDVGVFARHNLLLQAPLIPLDGRRFAIDPPGKSVPETASRSGRVHARLILDVFAIVATVHRQLRTHRLKTTLVGLEEYRRERSSLTSVDGPETQRRVAEAAAVFNRIRPYVPVEMCCLIDSLSMVRFLAKRGLHVRLVMGVACDPFSAHAWVQHGPLVLNDSVGNTQAHVPIRVI